MPPASDGLVGETVIHDPFPPAVQLPPLQPAGDPVTVTGCDPGPYAGLADVGDSANALHVGGAAI